MGIILYASLALVAYVLYDWWAGRLPNLPGPWGVPILGYLPFLGRQMNITMTKLSKIYGPVFQIQVGSRRMVVVNGHQAVKMGLTGTKGLDFAARPNFASYAGFGVFGEHGYQPRHRMAKKLTLKAMTLFGDERKTDLQDIAYKAVELFFAEVDKAQEGGKPFNPKPCLYVSTWSIMTAICYGNAYDKDDPDTKRVLATAETFGKAVMFGVIYDYLPWTKYFLKQQLKDMDELMTKISSLSQRLAARNFSTWDGETTRTMADFIRKAGRELNKDDDLLEGGELTDDQLMKMLTELFGAGFGTVASICRWSMLLLAKYPEYQTPVQDELDRVLGRKEMATFDDAQRLPIAMATLAEVYRYSSMSALAITHATVKDTELMGFPVPFDTPVIFNLYSAHYDDAAFKDPYVFNPQRFLTDQGQIKSEMVDQIMPYGLGWRRCGGEPLAKLEIFLFFVSILQRKRIVCPPGTVLDPTNYIMTLGCDPAIFEIRLEERE